MKILLKRKAANTARQLPNSARLMTAHGKKKCSAAATATPAGQRPKPASVAIPLAARASAEAGQVPSHRLAQVVLLRKSGKTQKTESKTLSAAQGVGVAPIATSNPSPGTPAGMNGDLQCKPDVAHAPSHGAHQGQTSVCDVKQPSTPPSIAGDSIVLNDIKALVREVRALHELTEELRQAVQALARTKNPTVPGDDHRVGDGQRLIDIRKASALVGSSRSTVYEWIKAGQFVAPIRLSARSVRYRECDVFAWIEARSGVKK